MQPFYQSLGEKARNYPESLSYYDKCLSLPLYYGLTDTDQKKVIEGFAMNWIKTKSFFCLPRGKRNSLTHPIFHCNGVIRAAADFIGDNCKSALFKNPA